MLDDSDREQFIADGKKAVAAALDGEPHRGYPAFRDLEVVAETILTHLATWKPHTVELEAEPVAQLTASETAKS